MRRKLRRGGAYVEFALSLGVLIPLMLGVIGLGLNMLLQCKPCSWRVTPATCTPAISISRT